MNLRARLGNESGFTLTEMLVVLVILGIVLGGLTTLFVSATNSAADQNKRFQAQQQARLALDSLRREIHCANAVPSYSTTSITISLGSYCTTSGGAPVTVRWCTTGSGSRYNLIRTTAGTCTGGVTKADYLTTGAVFPSLTSSSPGTGQKAKLGVDLPVDLDPATASGRYELKDDIVLRNTSR